MVCLPCAVIRSFAHVNHRRNRDAMNISSNQKAKFVPGPLPRASAAPEDATYSGLLGVIDPYYFMCAHHKM